MPIHRRPAPRLPHPIAALVSLAGGLWPQAAAPTAGAARAPRGTPLRRTLRASVAEGVLAEVVGALAGPTVLTAWALHVGCSALEVGLVGVLPSLAQAVQLPAAWVTSAFARRRVAIAAVAASREVLLPLAVLPLLGLPRGAERAVLLAVAAASSVLAVAGNNAWTAWMGELVPERIRGRYFGRRTAIAVLGGTLAALGAGRALDLAGARGATDAALALLAAGACAAGVATTALMARQHDVPEPPAARPRLADALAPARDPRARGYLVYQVAWNAAVWVGGGYFAFHLLHDVGVPFTLLALHGAVVASLRIASAPVWGRVIDRAGGRPVLAACSLALSALPLAWIAVAPGRLWPLAIDATVGGVAWGGHQLASFAEPLAIAPRRGRPFWIAAFATAGGLAAAGATWAGGAAAAALPARIAFAGHAWHRLDAVFAASATGRLGAALLALGVADPGAGTLLALRRVARGALRPDGAAARRAA